MAGSARLAGLRGQPVTAPRRAAIVLSVALAGGWLCLLALAVPAQRAPLDQWTTVFSPEASRWETLVAQMDGQAFAQHASDPALTDLVDGYRGDRDQAAYRAARPVYGWLGWLAAGGGRRAAIAPALLVVALGGLALLAVAVDRLAVAVALSVRSPLLLLAAPASLAFLRWPGLCEWLATGLVLLGLERWWRGRTVSAVALFAVAALTRETTLLVPAAVAIHLLWSRRRLRPALPLLVPAAAYVLWAGVVRWRLEVLPSGSAQMGVPLAGFAEAVPSWRLPEVVTFLSLVGVAVLVWQTRQPVLRTIVLVHGAFLACLGPVVWWYWWGFGRVTLPLYALALLARPTAPAVASDGVAGDEGRLPTPTDAGAFTP